ncbi:zinc finger CCCH domain-containing protein 14 [Cimex lectularius]|uniref:Zinc finger CCCH domain-containing protein 14 n=1 Tax=Cimex lectularius TaxID=79782 RepID=A0A8I6RF17_CIMLE|nr:zinc finger CCCH domain-containing protein 14 [Cimex lectularius]
MKVGRLGEEVGQKVKSAIKAKLMELGIHIDNELPDYVMVLVANKKTQKQMEEDLLLFLGENTKLFTNWLHEVLKKLEKVTSSVKTSKKKMDEKKSRTRRRSIDFDSDESSIKKFKADDSQELSVHSNGSQLASDNAAKGDSLSDLELEFEETAKSNYLPMMMTASQIPVTESLRACSDNQQEDNAISTKGRDTAQIENTKPRERIKIVWEESDNKDTQMKSKKERPPSQGSRRSKSRERHKGWRRDFDDDNAKKESKYRGRSKSPKSKKLIDARDILTKRGVEKVSNDRRKRQETGPTSVIEKPNRENKEKVLSSVLKTVFREAEKAPPTVPSLVKVTPRPIRPPNMQPSCNLILRAVADAEKSIATSKIHQKMIDPVIEETKPRRHLEYAVKGNISVTLLNDRVSSNKPDPFPEPNDNSQLSLESNTNNELENMKTEDDSISMVVDSEDYIESLDSQDLFLSKQKAIKNGTNGAKKEKTDKRFIITLDSTTSDNEIEGDVDMGKVEPEQEEPELKEVPEETVKEEKFKIPVKQPFDRSRLGPKVNDPINFHSTSELESTSEEMSPMDISVADSETVESLKNKTRCKFWPECDSGELCPFFHPTTLCRMFPSCAFGDKCLFIHPACKFADKCLNTNCPYTHTSITPKPKVPVRTPLAPVMTSSSQICIYYPKCTKPFCPFLHVPKPCRFGSSCTKVGCEFSHPGSKNPYKWVANQ